MTRENYKILVVDDEPDIVDILTYNLEKESYQVEKAYNGKEAVKIAKVFLPNLILLDIMMPVLDGIETCRIIRGYRNLDRALIIFLTARSEEYSEVVAFESGADDYIIKPIKPRALMRRIHRLLSREEKENITKQKNIITIDNLKIDKLAYTLHIDGKLFSLPRKEFELMYFLVSNPGRVCRREELLRNIWGADVVVLIRTVDVHIRRIREKIGRKYIKTIKGVGYKFPLT